MAEVRRAGSAVIVALLICVLPCASVASVPQTARAPDRASARAHYLRGTTLEQQHDLAGAAVEYQAALERDPAMAVAHDRLGFVLGLQGRTADAIAEFERAVALQPD